MAAPVLVLLAIGRLRWVIDLVVTPCGCDGSFGLKTALSIAAMDGIGENNPLFGLDLSLFGGDQASGIGARQLVCTVYSSSLLNSSSSMASMLSCGYFLCVEALRGTDCRLGWDKYRLVTNRLLTYVLM